MSDYKASVQEPIIGLDMDTPPVKQTKGSYRYALNAVIETSQGNQRRISNEGGAIKTTNIPEGFNPIGDRYIGEDSLVVILKNETTGKEQIGVIDKNHKYTTVVDTAVLGLKITNQCQIIYRVRRGNERVIYWVDGLNKARTFNLDRPYNFYNQTYKNYVRAGGNPDTYIGEKWDASSFDLIKSYKLIPFFNNVEIVENGAVLPGSYNFSIQYVDEDLNPTEYINTSNVVRIFNDSTSNAFQRIRGSRNINTDAQSFPRTNKSIKLTVGNLDTSFPYYRVAIIRAAGNTGQPEQVLLSDLMSTRESIFIYSGNDSALTQGNLQDIIIDQEVIFAPQHIEQIENRLILANTKGKGINWCEFQKYASKISSDLVTKQVILNNVLSEPNSKNAKSTFLFRGYMPGEAYSFGIVYIFSDGTLSPVFHIPGISSTNTTSTLVPFSIINKYLDIHNCSVNNYWGFDSDGVSLTGKDIRFHRFPFRKDVNKPLVTKSTNPITINKYRLTVSFTLNPAWTPGPIEFPESGGTPLVIGYGINYQVDGDPNISQFTGQLTDTDLGRTITIYDDVTELNDIVVGSKGELETTSDLAVNYQTTGNERFLLSFNYESYILDSSIDNDLSEIFGIEFSNIERPTADVIGFYIVRNDRTEDDKLIIDNAIIGAMTEFEQYKSFGLLMPKQYYTANNCGNTGVPNKTLLYSDNSAWIFNPEYQFLNKKTEFTSIEVEGKYTEQSMNMPTISNVEGRVCNTGGSKGVYINDVQSGTSYNPDINKKKDKDDDGFDLLIGYRNTNIVYSIDDTISFPSKERLMHLTAASYQNFDTKTYYNVSVDNKIGIFITDGAVDVSWFYNSTTKKNQLLYAALVRDNQTAYSNFINRQYYKEHNNPILFGSNDIINNVEIYNGDAEIGAMNMVSSVFYDMVVADRAKKSKIWKIVAGAVLIVVGVVASIFTAGAASGIAVIGAGVLAGLAISYGVSLAVSGIKFEQFKSMVDVDYEKGLKETVVDGGVYETVRDNIEREDDTIRWFADRVSNIYIESSVPIALRSGLTCGVPDFMDAPAPYDEAGFRTYLTEKLTTIDRDQGSGRLYKGYTTAEFYDINLDYLRFNKEKIFIHLPLEYDCCSDQNETFPLRRWYSEQSFQEEKTDNYRVFLPNNYSDMEGHHGEITNMYRFGRNLYVHTKEGLWNQPANVQERVTNEIVSFIGTGDFLGIKPEPVVDDNIGSAGSQHKWATIKTKNGVIFLNEIEGTIFLHGQGIKAISIQGIRNFSKENLRPHLVNQMYNRFSVRFKHFNNPANPSGVGYLGAYDSRFERVLVTKKDYLILPEKLEELKIVSTKIGFGNEFVYALDDGNFYVGNELIKLTNKEYFEDKSFTLSYSFHTGYWVSFHSYLPNYYLYTQNNVYSFDDMVGGFWKHNIHNLFHNYYGTQKPFLVDIVSYDNPLQDKIFSYLILQTQASKFDELLGQFVDVRMVTFNKLLAWNSRQATMLFDVKPKSDEEGAESWLEDQVEQSQTTILASRSERDWSINDFRDYVVDYKKPMFRSDWNSIKDQYPIDKVLNLDAVSVDKDWSEMEYLRDKFLVIRLIFDNFSDVSLSLDYSVQTEQPSV